jgi:large conductance mechanosensitive channel
MLKEFREFAVKGNVVDMAVGIMIGAAFGAVVKSVVDDVIMPPIGFIVGDLDFSDRFIVLKEGAAAAAPYASLEAAKAAGANVLAYGRLVTHVTSFLILAWILFFAVRWVNRLRTPDAPPPSTTRPCPFCKSAIDKTASRCAFCTSEVEPA